MSVELAIDWWGNFFEKLPRFFANQRLYQELRAAGVVLRCLPLSINRGPQHTKFCMIDGEHLLFGGSNVADHYTAWQDTNFYLSDLQIDWSKWQQLYQYLIATNSEPAVRSGLQLDQTHELYFSLPPKQPHFELQLLELCQQAQQHLNLVTWYFAPNQEVMEVLEAALQRGVHVELMISRQSRLWFYNLLNLPSLRRLQKYANFHLQYWEVGYNHSKLYWNEQRALLGSANLDIASLERSRELVVVSTSAQLLDQLDQRFIALKQQNIR